MAPEEEICGDRKFVSYIDLVFEDEAVRCSLEKHEAFAKNLCRLLSQTPEIPAAVEVVIRRCYYHCEVDERQSKAGNEARAGDSGEAEEVGGEDIRAVETATNEGVGRDFDERQSGAANREGADRIDASERIKQQADVGHGMKCRGNADAGVQAEADIEKAKTAERWDQTAEDERVGRSGLDGSVSGFCFTAYVTGFGGSDHEPHLRWQIALALLQNALVQLGQRLMREGVMTFGDELLGAAE